MLIIAGLEVNSRPVADTITGVEGLVNNNIFLLYIVALLYVAITGVKMTERARISLVYMFTFILALVDSIPWWALLAGSTIVLFISLEILSDDEMKMRLFTRPRYKFTDFAYRLLVEYYYVPFVAATALLFLPISPPLRYVLACPLMLFTTLWVMSQRYATKSITDIIAKLESDMAIYQMKMTPGLQANFGILIDMEDGGFFTRGDRQHTIPFRYIFTKGLHYLRVRGAWHIFRKISNLFNRGYGTIEMQLTRTIGIEAGSYAHKYRRKIFEFLYSNMILNGYREYLQRQGTDCRHFREFIIWKYVDNVPVKINGTLVYPGKKSSLLKLFGKDDITKITKEEFFIWCLGLPQWEYVGPFVLNYYDSFMRHHSIDRNKVARDLCDFL